MKLKSLFIITLIATSLSITSCASNKKKAASSEDTSVDTGITDNGANKGVSLELNGDSDTNRAGALKTVYFDFNSSSIAGSTQETLNGNVDFLKANPAVKVQVEGHADERGSVQFNLALGEKRAKGVREYLISQGVAGNRVTTISIGKEKPVSFGHDEESWSKNRRANFVVTEK
jgi:peptidoglycan-associated lipoprotein